MSSVRLIAGAAEERGGEQWSRVTAMEARHPRHRVRLEQPSAPMQHLRGKRPTCPKVRRRERVERTPKMALLRAARGTTRALAQRAFRRSLPSSSPPLPTKADAVIIGGGSIGTSTLYHLQKLGLNAVLIEGNELTAGRRGIAPACCGSWRAWRASSTPTSSSCSIQKLVAQELPNELDGDWAGWVNQGAIFACSSRERLVSHNRGRLLANAMFGVEAYDLSPSEAARSTR